MILSNFKTWTKIFNDFSPSMIDIQTSQAGIQGHAFPEVISHCTHTQTVYPRQADIDISTNPDSCLHNFVYAIFPTECVSNMYL